MKITKTRDEWYDDYMDYRVSFKYKKPANDFVRCFLNWCDRTYLETKYLEQRMIDTWCTKRETEKNRSHAGRIMAVNAFLKYLNKRGEGPYLYTVYSHDIDPHSYDVDPLEEGRAFKEQSLFACKQAAA